MEHTAKEHTAKPAEATTVSEPPVEKKHHAGTSSKGSRRLAQIDRSVSKAVRRVTRALDRGVDTYIEHRDKSKATRKDGVIVDFVENVSYGVSRAVSEASPLIHDVAAAFNTRPVRSGIRTVARSLGSIPFVG